ncbi:hypothetical protein RD792_008722 [Penstemon davidsonii]|uniref:F-box domain-containing protein n=1 Tax=Penstemon davidsonii TaxID=160366 RepID=A0ABR0DA06_9LAMI|nr:hypothetical protein RD792_008722 [Penstemon davidsonii]
MSTPRTHHSYSKRAKTDFNSLPYDVIVRIAAPFRPPDLIGASLVCVAWRDALKPLREAMVFTEAGKILKREHKRVNAMLGEALEAFLKGAARGYTPAMVEVGLIYYLDMGRKDEGILWYRRAAELGDPAGQYHLAMFYFQLLQGACLPGNNPYYNTKVAIEYLHKAAIGGHALAQHQLAHCYHQGRGVTRSISQTARWFLRAAEGGYMPAMMNIALCYILGIGVVPSNKSGGIWHKRAIASRKDHGCRDEDSWMDLIRIVYSNKEFL